MKAGVCVLVDIALMCPSPVRTAYCRLPCQTSVLSLSTIQEKDSERKRKRERSMAEAAIPQQLIVTRTAAPMRPGSQWTQTHSSSTFLRFIKS